MKYPNPLSRKENAPQREGIPSVGGKRDFISSAYAWLMPYLLGGHNYQIDPAVDSPPFCRGIGCQRSFGSVTHGDNPFRG